MEKTPETNKTKIICAWCKKEMGEKEGPGGVTHDICEECEKSTIQKTKEFKE